jgi:AbrB family looped-hinge helix DNA binding protein
MPVAKISSKGWIVIPSELRKKYNLNSGSSVRVVDYGGVLSLVPTLDDPIEEAMGILSGRSSLTKALARERQKEPRRGKKST